VFRSARRVLHAVAEHHARSVVLAGRPPVLVRTHPDVLLRHFTPLAYGSLREKPALTHTQVGHFSTDTGGPLFARP
jgi:hypothetical protein